MQCIYLEGDVCLANVTQAIGARYKPEEEVKTKLCKNDKFDECPRLRAFADFLKASRGK
jgi:hypothetical protein